MEPTIGLRFSALPNQSICMPSGLYAARATKSHLSFSHSSLSLPKDSKSHSLGYNSSLSLPKSSRGHRIEHIPGPITCKVDDSLTPTYNRVDKGRANMAWGSTFLRNIGSDRRANRNGFAAKTDGLPLKKDLHSQIVEIAQFLRESRRYDLALELLKVYEPEVEKDSDPSYYVRMEIIYVLFLQGKYEEAWTYCEELSKNEGIYSHHFKSGPFYGLKSSILLGLNKDKEAIECMKKFNEYQSEAFPLTPPDKM